MYMYMNKLQLGDTYITTHTQYKALTRGTTIKFNIVGRAVERIFLSRSSRFLGIAETNLAQEDIVPSISNSFDKLSAVPSDDMDNDVVVVMARTGRTGDIVFLLLSS